MFEIQNAMQPSQILHEFLDTRQSEAKPRWILVSFLIPSLLWISP
jgi:hypothetical protein